MNDEHKDVFISYKNDIAGSNFAARLCADFEQAGYKVFFNLKQQGAGEFPDRIKQAIESCTDFLLVLTQACLDQLKRHEKIDWVREEILIAKQANKNIIPLLMPGVVMPKDKDEMPEDLRFLPYTNAIYMPDAYDISPLQTLFGWLQSKPLHEVLFEGAYNNSEKRSIDDDFRYAAEHKAEDKAGFELANLLYFGLVGDERGCKRDYQECYKVLNQLVGRDTEYGVCANSIIGEMYYHGTVPREKQSYAKSFQYHEKAKTVSGFSRREAAYLKSRGCGTAFDYTSIIDYYSEAIKNGDMMAIMELAKLYKKFGKFKEAEELFLRSKSVLPEAQFQLGMLYRDGLLSNPPQPDFYKAAYYFQRAIDSGYLNPEVYHQLGRLYLTPVGDFEGDFALAEKYFKLAADEGNKSAQYKLGLMYEYGYVEQSIQKAIHYHSLAAAKGNAKSAYHLALLYQDPSQRNYREAFKNAELSAKKGIMEGEFIYAIFLFYGRGCIANEDKAYEFFLRAYEHGMYAAKIYLDKFHS